MIESRHARLIEPDKIRRSSRLRHARRHFIAAMLLTASALPLAAWDNLAEESDPNLPASAFEIYTHGRVFFGLTDLSLMLEYVGRFEGAARDFRYQSITAGGYYRVLRNMKLGAFYRLQLNARHDDDWIGEDGSWHWVDASGRIEHVGILDISPRFELGFLPGKTWVGMVKARYEYNFSTGDQSLLVRPGLTWFWIRDREPILNLSAQYATYLSLNFGTLPWYRHGPYLNLLYHFGPNLQFDVALSRQWIYWSESAQFLASFPGETYGDNIYSPWILDAGIILRL